MRLALTISGTLLHALSIAASTNKVGLPSERIHPRALVPRDGRDCGKFVMYCEKAAGACNNACYHINCFDKNSATMVYVKSRWIDSDLLMAILVTMPATPIQRIASSQDAKLPMAPSVTNCRSAKSFTIRSTVLSEIQRSIVMSGQWQQPNKTTSKMAQSEIVFDAYRPRKILVRCLYYCLPRKLTS